jgi:hypothetical protein
MTEPFKSDLVQLVRTLVRGDFEANDRYEQKLDEAGWEGFPRFLSAVFFLAVGRRFARDADIAEIIRFVADIRAKTGACSVDPVAAETLIWAALDLNVAVNIDENVAVNIDDELAGTVQLMVVHQILADENLSDEDLDGFLREAVRLGGGETGG